MQEQNESKKEYFGKIKDMVGNEIKISIAKEPEGGIEAYMQQISQASGEIDMEGLGEDVAVEIMPGDVELSQEEIDKILAEGGEFVAVDSEEFDSLNLEYTGEEKEIVIPAGVEVYDLRTESKSSLSVMKKNMVIKVHGEEVEGKIVVSKIDIVE